MKKTKSIMTLLLCAMLSVVSLVGLTACSEYKTLEFKSTDGYTFSMGDSVFLIKNAAGDVIGEVIPGDAAWSINNKNEISFSGIRKDASTVDIEVRLKLEYDHSAVKVEVNDKEATHISTSSDIVTRSVDGEITEELFTSLKYKYDVAKGDKSFVATISGIKAMTIGGHKWTLRGVMDADGYHFYGSSILGNGIIGEDVDYTFSFNNDNSVLVDILYGGEAQTLQGTWTEENGTLKASIAANNGSYDEVLFTFMTEAERKQYITDAEANAQWEEDKKALGAGVWGEMGLRKMAFVIE